MDFLKRNLVTASFFGILLGIGVRNSFAISRATSYLIILVSLALFLSILLKSLVTKTFSREKVLFLLTATFFMFFGGAILRYNASLPNVADVFEKSLGKEVVVAGVVSNFPEIGTRSTKIIMDIEGERILVHVPVSQKISYGQEVKIKGTLALPEEFETDNGELFDYPKFLEKDHIRYILEFPKVESAGEFKGNRLVGQLYRLKSASIALVDRELNEPKSSLLSGILLGDNSGSEKMEETFRKVGLSHIIVLSGYNMAIVSMAILFLLRRAPVKFKYTVASLSIILFTIMVASGAATIRAAAMALIALFAKNISRRTSVWRILFLACFLMILHNPLIVFRDIGFQLSFLATAGIIAFSKMMEKKLKFIPESLKFIREITAVSLSAQAAVLPLLIYLSGTFSIYSIHANLIVLPIMPLAMFFGFILICFSFFSSVVAMPIAFFNDIILSFIIKTADFFANLPFSSVSIFKLPAIIVFSLYFGVFVLLYYRHWKKNTNNLKVIFKNPSQNKWRSENI